MSRDRAASELERLIDEIRHALAFGRAHVVLIAEGADARELPSRLALALRDAAHTVTLRLDACDTSQEALEERVATALREACTAPLPPQDPLSPAPPQHARRVLLVPNALSVPAASLRVLHELGARQADEQRLVLLVDRSGSAFDDPARELARRLGVGVSKIEREQRASVASELSRRAERELGSTDAPEPLEPDPLLPQAPLPPVVARKGKHRTRPIAVRSHGRRRRGSQAARLGVALGLVAAALAAAPAVVRHARPEAKPPLEARVDSLGAAGPENRPALETDGPPGTVPAALPLHAEARPEASPEPESAPAPAPALPPVGRPRTAAGRARDTAPESAVGTGAAPAILVGVNFNADPWADLEVDGRRIGSTPISGVALAPGEHRVRAVFPDGRVVERLIRVDALRNRFRIE